jgi:hypothetical protein
MSTWHFYQGLKDEWRWYRLSDAGAVVSESDRGFAELRACMVNAEDAGFRGNVFRVHTRASTDRARAASGAQRSRSGVAASIGCERNEHTT